MNIIVCIKQVPDTEASLTVKNGNSINEENIKWIISPYDEYAIEEALKLKEKISDSTVTVISMGPARVESALRNALAMGAQQAIHIETSAYMDNHLTAKVLAKAIARQENFGIVFMGKQAIDDDAYLTPILVAEALNIPLATNVMKFSYENSQVTVEREIDEGAREKIVMQSPCVIAANKGLNEPRYASLMGIMKAKKIPISKLTPEELGINPADVKVIPEKLYSPPEKPQGKVIEGEIEVSVKELVRLLKAEAKVL
jgi:electron transfer flavoprotein beta subunit